MEMQRIGRDETELIWMQAIAEEWQEELADPREDIYTLEDGEPIDALRRLEADG